MKVRPDVREFVDANLVTSSSHPKRGSYHRRVLTKRPRASRTIAFHHEVHRPTRAHRSLGLSMTADRFSTVLRADELAL
jgi:hypothetical protein